MTSSSVSPSVRVGDVLSAWWGILRGRVPMLSIEITRECPLKCPGCYAYGEEHLGGGMTLRDLRDFRGDSLVEGVIGLVRSHKPIHVSLVGGEPLIRHRELSRILPALSAMGVFTMVVTSAVIPIPAEWMKIPRFRVAVSVDGLPEHHDERRKPATYEKILENIRGCEVNIHWVVTRPMLERPGYLAEYVSFWSARPEVNRIWLSVYTPQMREQTAEMLTQIDRESLARQLPALQKQYPKLLFNEGLARAFLKPPASPDDCLFAKMSANYSADLRSRVEPCVFGGAPDCSQCGCAASIGLHWIRGAKIAGPLKVGHMVGGSINIGTAVNRLRKRVFRPSRWEPGIAPPPENSNLVSIESSSLADLAIDQRGVDAAIEPTGDPLCFLEQREESPPAAQSE